MLDAALYDEIKELNLSYLILAKQLASRDKDQARLQLGMNDESLTILQSLSAPQLIQLASTNLLLCSMRFNEEHVWKILLEKSHKDGVLKQTHQAILLAGLSGKAVTITEGQA